MTLKSVALVGATGRLGTPILDALLASNSFNVIVLARASSKSKYPATVQVIQFPDDPTSSDLVPLLHGQDALVLAIAGSRDLQIRFADAAAEAGVKRVIPADYGSVDSSSPRALELVPIYVAKTEVRKYLQKLAEDGKLSWTSLVTGHFFDDSLKKGYLGYDLGERTARIFDGGDIKWSSTTTERIGKAVVKVLEKEKETKNKMLFIQSFCVSQNEVLACLEKVMRVTWRVEHLKSDEFVTMEKEKTDTNPDDGAATENLVMVLGIIDGNWEKRDGFANGLLGLENEELEKTILKIVKEA